AGVCVQPWPSSANPDQLHRTVLVDLRDIAARLIHEPQGDEAQYGGPGNDEEEGRVVHVGQDQQVDDGTHITIGASHARNLARQASLDEWHCREYRALSRLDEEGTTH